MPAIDHVQQRSSNITLNRWEKELVWRPEVVWIVLWRDCWWRKSSRMSGESSKILGTFFDGHGLHVQELKQDTFPSWFPWPPKRCRLGKLFKLTYFKGCLSLWLELKNSMWMICNGSYGKAEDCGMCPVCLDKPKYGGPGKKKKCCIKRNCQQFTWCTSSTHDLPDSASTLPPDITKVIKTLRTKLGS